LISLRKWKYCFLFTYRMDLQTLNINELGIIDYALSITFLIEARVTLSCRGLH
jgi:hypothetical protein